jgi:hypothetical protein
MTSSKRAVGARAASRTGRNSSTASQDAFKELSRRVGSLLREHDFRGSGQNFTRECGEIWQGVGLQRSRWVVSIEEPVRFYLNFGLYFADLSSKEFDWRKSYKEFRAFRPAFMDLTLRSSELGARAGDSWEVGEETLERVWKQVEGVLRGSVIPVLDWVSTREGAIEFCLLIPWHLDRAVRAWLGRRAPDAWTPDEVEAERLREALARRLQAMEKPSTRSSTSATRSRKASE